MQRRAFAGSSASGLLSACLPSLLYAHHEPVAGGRRVAAMAVFVVFFIEGYDSRCQLFNGSERTVCGSLLTPLHLHMRGNFNVRFPPPTPIEQRISLIQILR